MGVTPPKSTFEAVDSIDLPFSSQDLRMSKEEEEAKPARRSGIDLSRGLPRPSPYLPFEQAKRAVFEFYETYGHHLRSFVMGLEVWDGLGPSEREKVVAQLERKLPEAAIRHYEDRYRSLALDVPEFALCRSTPAAVKSASVSFLRASSLCSGPKSRSCAVGVRSASSRGFDPMPMRSSSVHGTARNLGSWPHPLSCWRPPCPGLIN